MGTKNSIIGCLTLALSFFCTLSQASSIDLKDNYPTHHAVRKNSVLKLSPHMRKKPVDLPVRTVNLADIQPFLDATVAVEENQLDGCGYILSFGREHVAGGMSSHFYARHLCSDTPGQKYTIFRQTQPYIDPETQKPLGYEVNAVGQATLEKPGDPASLIVNRSNGEVKIGDRLVPWTEEKLQPYFIPRLPDKNIRGRIVAATGGLITQIEQNRVVVLNRGRADGVLPGHLFYLYKEGDAIVDPIRNDNKMVKLPHEYEGEIMAFRVLNHLSYALVMRGEDLIHVNDEFGWPDDKDDDLS